MKQILYVDLQTGTILIIFTQKMLGEVKLRFFPWNQNHLNKYFFKLIWYQEFHRMKATTYLLSQSNNIRDAFQIQLTKREELCFANHHDFIMVIDWFDFEQELELSA